MIYLLNLDRSISRITLSEIIEFATIGGLNVSRKFARTLWSMDLLRPQLLRLRMLNIRNEKHSFQFSSHFPALVFNSQSFHSISVNVGQATRFFPFPNLSYTLTSRRKSNQRLTPINPYQISVFINSMNPLTYDQIPQFLVATQKQW